MNYIVITTTTNLDNVKIIGEYLAKQTIKPLKWFIFNDSYESKEIIIKGLNLEVYNLEKNNYWYYKRLAINLNKLMKEIPKEIWDKTDYILKLDDDTIIPKDYVESLIPFIKKSNFGCISGKIISKTNGKYIEEKRINYYAIGTGMLIRKKIFEYLKEYPMIAGSDTVINIASCYLGFQNQQLNDLTIKQTRLTCGNCVHERFMNSAIKQHYLRYPKWIIFLNFKRECKKKELNWIPEWMYYCGLINDIKEEERLNNWDLVSYNKQRLLMVILRELKKKWF